MSSANINALQHLRLNEINPSRSSGQQVRIRNYFIMEGNSKSDVREIIIDPNGLPDPMQEILMDQQNMQEEILRQHNDQRVADMISLISKKGCKRSKGRLIGDSLGYNKYTKLNFTLKSTTNYFY